MQEDRMEGLVLHVVQELLDRALQLLSAAGAKGLRLAHVDLGSGTDCEQLLFDLKARRVELTVSCKG